jgi:hypothetical protein
MSKAFSVFVLGGSIALVAGGLFACVGDAPDLESNADAGPTTEQDGAIPSQEGGALTPDGGAGALPRIDQYSISHQPWSTGTFAQCVASIDAAAKAMGGGYVAAATGASFARYADRSGATIIASCVETAAEVVTESWAVTTAANAQNDEQRLHRLVHGGGQPPPASNAVNDFPNLTAVQRIYNLGVATPIATCQQRAKGAIDRALAKTSTPAKTWTALGGNFLAVGGTDGLSASISCLSDTGIAVIDVLSLDGNTVLAALVEAEFASGGN